MSPAGLNFNDCSLKSLKIKPQRIDLAKDPRIFATQRVCFVILTDSCVTTQFELFVKIMSELMSRAKLKV